MQSTDENIVLNAKGNLVLYSDKSIGLQSKEKTTITSGDLLEITGKPITIKADGKLKLDGGDVEIVPNTEIKGELKVKGTNLVVT